MSRLVYGLCRALTWLGGFVLIVVAVMTLVSIVGRALIPLGLKPVPGDFELVELGCGFAVFCFMPWCYLRRGHAVVDMLWNTYPRRMQQVLQVFTDALMLGVWLLLTWRTGVGMLDYRANGEVSFILQLPVWWGYAGAVFASTIGCLAYAWRLLEDLGLATPPPQYAAAPSLAGH